jgi:hypothetical protein
MVEISGDCHKNTEQTKTTRTDNFGIVILLFAQNNLFADAVEFKYLIVLTG